MKKKNNIGQLSNDNDKSDCFAWLSEHECNALTCKDCKCCSFYKPKSQVPNYSKYLCCKGKK